jgi:hypothetical protein
MDFGLAMLHMFPNIQPSQYELMRQSDGSVAITRWDSTTTPQPTEQQVIDFYNSPNGMLPYFQQQKINELTAKCDATIQAGFSSSALGVPHTYPATVESMIYFNATINRFLVDPTFTTLKQLTLDAGYLDHTKEQFIQVFNDGHQFGIVQDGKLAQLKYQVSQATTPDQVNQVTW